MLFAGGGQVNVFGTGRAGRHRSYAVPSQRDRCRLDRHSAEPLDKDFLILVRIGDSFGLT